MSEELNIDKQTEQLDYEIAEQEYFIQRAKDLKELMEDEKFQRVFIEGYLEVEAQRVFKLLTHPLTLKPEDVANYQSQLATIKNFSRFLGMYGYRGTVQIQADNAPLIIDNLKEQKQELLVNKGDK